MTKLYLLTFSACLFFFGSANATLVYPAEPNVKATLTSKAGDEYKLRLTYDIHHGVTSLIYDFGKAGNFIKLYSGYSYGEEEQCPKNKPDIILPNAEVHHSYFKKDLNDDGVEDLILNIVEKDCKSGKLTFLHITVTSSNKGFDIKND